MESTQFALAIFGVLLAIGIQSGLAISCYECNSHWKYDGEACDDPLDRSKIELVDCDKHYGELYGISNFTMCRKMVQEVQGERRLMRSCAQAGNDKCADRTGTKQVKIRYCECYGDECNGAPAVVMPSILSVMLAIFAALWRL